MSDEPSMKEAVELGMHPSTGEPLMNGDELPDGTIWQVPDGNSNKVMINGMPFGDED